MFKQAIRIGVTGAAWALCLAAGCASAPPKELESARRAVREAQEGLAKELTPAQLHDAEKSLKLAEATFEAEGDTARTRDRAYVATRRAQLAQVQARIHESETKLHELEQQLNSGRTEKLTELRDTYAEQRAELAAVERARKDAEQRAKQLSEELAQVACVHGKLGHHPVGISGAG